MKTTALGLLLCSLLSSAFSQETEHFSVIIALADEPSSVVGGGEFRLTGTNLLYSLDLSGPAAFVSTGTVKMVSSGVNLFPLAGLFCSADRGCGFFGETNITLAQAGVLRSGGAQVVVDEVYRGLIVPNPLCQSPGGTSIQLKAGLSGRVSVHNRTRVVWGEMDFNLNGNLLRYQVDLPALAGSYFGKMIEGTQPVPLGLGDWPVILVGTIDCGPTATNLPPATGGFDSLPRCVREGSICIPDDVVASLLAGLWSIDLFHSFTGQNVQGRIFPVDTDHDGVPDYRDGCPNTPVGTVINADGCSIEQLAPCAGPWRNHGDYVNRIKAVTADFLRAGLITEAQRRVLLIRAAQSGCGK